MNIWRKHRLKNRQKALMRRYTILEQLQTEYSEDEYFYRCTQKEMDAIDEESEQIRHVLEMGCCE